MFLFVWFFFLLLPPTSPRCSVADARRVAGLCRLRGSALRGSGSGCGRSSGPGVAGLDGMLATIRFVATAPQRCAEAGPGFGFHSPAPPPSPPTCSSPLVRCPMGTTAGRAAAGRPSVLFSASFQEEEKSGASRAGLGRGGRWRGGKLKITPKAACLPPPPTAPCSGSIPRVRG